MDLPGSGASRDLVKCSRALPQFSELRSMPTAAAAAIAAIAAADGRNVQSQGIQTTVQAVTCPQETSVSFLSLLCAAFSPLLLRFVCLVCDLIFNSLLFPFLDEYAQQILSGAFAQLAG